MVGGLNIFWGLFWQTAELCDADLTKVEWMDWCGLRWSGGGKVARSLLTQLPLVLEETKQIFIPNFAHMV